MSNKKNYMLYKKIICCIISKKTICRIRKITCCVRCLLITESPKTPGHYRYRIWVLDKKNYMSFNDF